jgi:N-acetylmuramoyl-L-alanine amidase
MTRRPATATHFAIAIDPGHTREQPGAISARGVPERAFNEALSAQVVASLRRAGFAQTFATHPDDAAGIGLEDRTRVARSAVRACSSRSTTIRCSRST